MLNLRFNQNWLNLNKICNRVNNCTNVNFLYMIIVLSLYKMLSLEEFERGKHGTLLYYFCSFYVNLKLFFRNKVFLKVKHRTMKCAQQMYWTAVATMQWPKRYCRPAISAMDSELLLPSVIELKEWKDSTIHQPLGLLYGQQDPQVSRPIIQ